MANLILAFRQDVYDALSKESGATTGDGGEDQRRRRQLVMDFVVAGLSIKGYTFPERKKQTSRRVSETVGDAGTELPRAEGPDETNTRYSGPVD